MEKKRRRKKSEYNSPRLGDVNRAIDEFFHPHFHKGPIPIILDSLAHAMVEQNPPKSLEKFVEFNLGPFVREVRKMARTRKRKRPK